ncbi:MAG TPA: hypothetical protein DCL15_12820, partial [Chloroflexi bacterium]|nr:hypothetical protein [Chloroflexota bacterium]
MLLTIANLTKAYGAHQVLANVTLTMHRGDKWGLVGANGVGKSTAPACSAHGRPR